MERIKSLKGMPADGEVLVLVPMEKYIGLGIIGTTVLPYLAQMVNLEKYITSLMIYGVDVALFAVMYPSLQLRVTWNLRIENVLNFLLCKFMDIFFSSKNSKKKNVKGVTNAHFKNFSFSSKISKMANFLNITFYHKSMSKGFNFPKFQ